jgi:hypothetical protein
MPEYQQVDSTLPLSRAEHIQRTHDETARIHVGPEQFLFLGEES